MPVMVRSADIPVAGRRLGVSRPTIEWDDVRHGSRQLVLGPDPLLQVRQSSAPGGSSFVSRCLFVRRLQGARVLHVGQDRREELALPL